MKKIVLVVVAALLLYGSLSYHVIVTDDGVKVLRKADMSLKNTFVDARGAKLLKVLVNPDLLKSGVKRVLSPQ